METRGSFYKIEGLVEHANCMLKSVQTHQAELIGLPNRLRMTDEEVRQANELLLTGDLGKKKVSYSGAETR